MGNYLNRQISYEKLLHPQIGFIKRVEDPKFFGRLWVWVPAFETPEDDELGWILCNYCSPFAGSTNRDDLSKHNYDEFERTQTSYGFWAVPPDLNNEVLVMFPNGDISRAIWVGCLYKEYMNSSVPGQNISELNKNVRGKELPVAEYNKYDKVSGDAADPLNPIRPWNRSKADGIGNQGLISDRIRGISNSSSHKSERPNVFGFSSPGPLTDDGKGRMTGSSIVFDDDPDNEHICMTTRSGAKLVLSETHGIAYLINKRGTGWIQIDDDGNIDFFAAGDISMRSRGTFNLRADIDINIEAGQNMHVKAAKDTNSEGEFVGELNGLGGDIKIEAMNDYHTAVEVNQYHLVRTGDVDIKVSEGNTTTYIKGNQSLHIDGDQIVKISGDRSIKIESNDKIKIGGSHGYTVDGNVSYAFKSDFTINVSGKFIQKVNGSYSLASTNVNVTSGGDISGNGKFKSGGDMFASDFKTPSIGLVGHQHAITAFVRPDVHGATVDPGFSGQGSTTVSNGDTGATPALPDEVLVPKEASPKMPNDKLDILKDFPDTTAVSYGGKVIEIPDWWDRDDLEIKTIADRLITFEPCPEHKNKGE